MKQNTNSEVPKRLAVRIDQQSLSKVMAVSKDTINNLCFDSLAEEEKFSLLVKVTEMYHDTIVRPVPLFVDIHEQGMEQQPSTCYLTTTVVRKRKLQIQILQKLRVNCMIYENRNFQVWAKQKSTFVSGNQTRSTIIQLKYTP